MPELPRGTVTFLFTDIEGSTRLLHELGAEAYAEALAGHRRVLRDAFERHGGVEVDTQGDAFFVAFPTAPGALEAAEEAQAALELPVRMGLHTGTPLLTGEGYVGADVHRAARIAAVGHGRQVLVSAATAALAQGGRLRALGEHRLKDFDEPVAIFQLGESSFPPLRTISNTNLPRPVSSFVGREREVADVVGLIREGAQLVTLTGPGGSGKSRLAIEAAAELVGEFRSGVFWVGLASLRDPELVPETVAEVLGAKDGLAAEIGQQEMLLVLDNLEQVVAAAPGLAALVEACPNLVLLGTSRELLRVRGEVEYEVLALAGDEAAALFCARAGIEVSAAVEELCRRLDDMPLALELAAARTKALSPEQILDRLGQRLDLFKGGRDADPRQSTLRATMEWSHELLSAEEQRLFRRIAVFAGCTLAAVEEVCEADVDTLQSLVEKSLVRRTGGRYWMLETIREYAAALLEECEEADDYRSRHLDALTGIARAAGLTQESSRPMRHALVIPERDNIRAALAWAVKSDPVRGLELATALENYWVSSGDPREGVRWVEALLARGSAPPALHARAIRSLGNCTVMLGDRRRGLELYEQSLAELEALGDEAGYAVTLSRVAFNCDDPERTRVLGTDALERFRRLGIAKGEAQALTLFGGIERRAGNLAAALDYYEQSIEPLRACGFTWWEQGAQLERADLYFELVRPREAGRAAREALALARRMDDRTGLLVGLARVARAAAALDDEASARRLWRAMEAELERDPVEALTEERDFLRDALGASTGSEEPTLSLEEAVEEALGP